MEQLEAKLYLLPNSGLVNAPFPWTPERGRRPPTNYGELDKWLRRIVLKFVVEESGKDEDAFLNLESSKKEIAKSYMDCKSPSKKASEVARELLIAISDSLPDKVLDSTICPDSKKPDGFAIPNGDWDDKFRSELISISYVESLDAKI